MIRTKKSELQKHCSNQNCIPKAPSFWKVSPDPTLGLCTHTHITPPPPKRLYEFLSHGVTVLNSALDTKSTLHDASSPQTRGQSKVHEVCLRVWPCRGRAKTRMPFLPPQNMQTTLSFAVFAKALGLGGAHWHHTCCYRISDPWDQVCFLLSLSLRWKVQK